MGYVVNPKLVYCKYDLISSGKMEDLRTRIEDIEDETKRTEELQKYNELIAKLNTEIDAEIGEETRKELEEEARKNLDNGIGKEEILRQNVKKGGKYIVFIPVTDQGEIEDEDGNKIGTKTGEDKLKAYQDYLNKVFEGTDIKPQCHAMSGSWNGKDKNKAGEDRNQQELNAFEADNSDETKFMVVMNKANEGLHIDSVDGIIWFRALDENSRILYLQQLGRAIYTVNEDNPLPDDKRPVIIDLVNNSLTVKIEKKFENAEPIDDLEAFTIVTEWIEQHNGMLPDRNSSNKQEQHYYAVLRRIKNKYSKYLDGFDDSEELTDEEKNKIQAIIDLATEIDLWNIDLLPISKTRGSKEEFDPFIIEGVLKDFIEFEDEIDSIEQKTTYEQVIEFLKSHNGILMRGNLYNNNNKKLKIDEMTEEQQEEVTLYARWRRSKEREILKEYAGEPIEEVPEEYREKIALLRKFGLRKKEKAVYEQVIDFLKSHNGILMRGTFFNNNNKRLKKDEMTEEQQEEVTLYSRWRYSKEREILKEYAGEPIEEVPEEYREKIALLRKFGLRKKEKAVYEQVIDFLKSHNGILMRGTFFNNNNKRLKKDEMTEEQQEEVTLYSRWRYSKEREILKEYAGEPIEEVPEEYREKIALLRKFGLGMKRSKLSQVKQQRDEAKSKNAQTKELEHQVSEELKKRGKKHEEQ
ncbi:MAG: hypothetical protein Q4G09_04840 [Clostridia bacterium]|nr:hypothetical protein [Clostridia bacterium]